MWVWKAGKRGRTGRNQAYMAEIEDEGPVDPILNPTISWWSDLPTRPVHGAVRNQLFFDWHVEAVRW
jgi:prepilin-type processing-associated H-X9-DG protein